MAAIVTTREQRRQMKRDNAKQPATLQPLPCEAWPERLRNESTLLRVWRSRDYLVQEYDAPRPALVRLSVLRTTLDASAGRWHDGLTWDELQDIKAQCGYAFGWAVEVFPAIGETVNVANIRHLWVLREAPAFAWRRASSASPQDQGGE